MIGLIIVVALYRLTFSVIAGLLFGVLDPLDQSMFQTVFGEILTLLIALEFNHTLQYVVMREQSIIQTKVVLLIALLAITRKFIILDTHEIGSRGSRNSAMKKFLLRIRQHNSNRRGSSSRRTVIFLAATIILIKSANWKILSALFEPNARG